MDTAHDADPADGAEGSGFPLSELERDLASASRRFLDREAAPDPSSPWSSAAPDLWRRVARELGWIGLGVREERGGTGGLLPEVCVVAEQAGRALLGVPFPESAAVAHVVDRFGDPEVADRLVPGLASGEVTGVGAFDTSLRFRRLGAGGVLDGEARWVVSGAAAGVLVGLADGDDGPALLAVGAEALARGSWRSVGTADRTRDVAHGAFEGVRLPPEAVVARGEEARRLAAAARAVRATVMASEDVGGAERTLELSVEHASRRRQFGQPVGAFQAVKHKLADVHRRVEHARTLARAAARAEPGDLLERACLAKAYGDATFVRAGAEMIQVHGGIGFTAEHPAHLYYKRASVNAHVVWPAASCREHVRSRLFGSGEPLTATRPAR